MFYKSEKFSNSPAGIKTILKSVATTALGKFIGNARSYIEARDKGTEPDRVRRTKEALGVHKAVYEEALRFLHTQEPTKWDMPMTLNEMLDFMQGGTSIAEADIDRIVSLGVPREEAERMLGGAKPVDQVLLAARPEITRLFEEADADPENMADLSNLSYYSYAVKAAGALAKARARVVQFMARGKIRSGKLLQEYDVAIADLLAWAREFEEEHAAEFEEQAGKGFPVQLVSEVFDV